MTDFNKILIHSSSVSKLFIEPRDAADKKAGNLSATAKTHLIEVYIREKYGRKKQIDSKYLEKGNKCESDSLLLLSETIGFHLEKNTERISNDYITGEPDAFVGESLKTATCVLDVKSSFDVFTFLGNLSGSLNDDYEKQIQSYLWLTGADNGYVAYCLVDMPNDMIEREKNYILKKTNAISDQSIEFKKEWANKLPLLMYSDIPENERILIFPVEKDPTFPEKCIQKVEKARQFLQEFENKHLNFNK